MEIAAESVSHVFTYRVPEGMEVKPGMRVLVPFGPRKVEGYALRLREDPGGVPEGKVRPVLRTLEDYPALLPALVDLAYCAVFSFTRPPRICAGSISRSASTGRQRVFSVSQ